MTAPRVITIGHFDGVHLGHRALAAAARDAAGRAGRVIVLAFEPHPLRLLRPDQAPPSLSTLDQRRAWLEEAGADEVVVLEPAPELLGRSPESFLKWLAAEHRPDFIVEGPDFRFGRERSGSVETLSAHEARFGYRTIVVEEAQAALANQMMVPVRSTLVRWLVARGRVRDAARLLGRPYELCGTVVPGERRGRQLDVPTANLDAGPMLLPADGVYTGQALVPGGEAYPAAISVGSKPTFGPGPRVCEAHLIGWAGALEEYGWSMRLRFGQWLRDQISYDGPPRLIAQLRRDIERVCGS